MKSHLIWQACPSRVLFIFYRFPFTFYVLYTYIYTHAIWYTHKDDEGVYCIALLCIVLYRYMPDVYPYHSTSWRVEVLLSFWQRLAVAGDPLTFVDAHAGAGVYDLLQGAATFHRSLGFSCGKLGGAPKKGTRNGGWCFFGMLPVTWGKLT